MRSYQSLQLFDLAVDFPLTSTFLYWANDMIIFIISLFVLFINQFVQGKLSYDKRIWFCWTLLKFRENKILYKNCISKR